MSNSKGTRTLINTSIKSIPAADYSPNSHTDNKNYVTDYQTSIIPPNQDHLTFIQVPKRIVIICTKKLERIIKSSQKLQWSDAYCGLSTTGLGGIIGGILSGMNPLSFWPFLSYLFAIIIFFTFGALYFARGNITKSDILENANDILKELEHSSTNKSGEENES